MSGNYANAVMIGHTATEFSFDFITTFFPRSAVAQRVFLAAPNARRLLESLVHSFQQFQQRLRNPPPSPPGLGRPSAGRRSSPLIQPAAAAFRSSTTRWNTASVGLAPVCCDSRKDPGTVRCYGRKIALASFRTTPMTANRNIPTIGWIFAIAYHFRDLRKNAFMDVPKLVSTGAAGWSSSSTSICAPHAADVTGEP